jgi:hypothetical protein
MKKKEETSVRYQDEKKHWQNGHFEKLQTPDCEYYKT